MKHAASRLPEGYFEALYTANPDPWGLASRDYERRKYHATLDALPRQRFRSGFEIGCAIGVLTRLLAQRTDQLLAIDIEQRALDQARATCADLKNIRFERMAVPASWPRQVFDLILISEVLYYFSPEDIARTAERTLSSAAKDAVVVLVHWIHPTDLPLPGDTAVGIFLASAGPRLSVTRRVRTADYRIDVLSFHSLPDAL